MSFSNKSFCVFYDENNKVKSINNGPGYMPSFEDIESLKKWCDDIVLFKDEYISYRANHSEKLNDSYKAENIEYNNQPTPKKQPKIGFVYLIKDEDNNTLKIGFSKNPKSRLKQLQIATSNKLNLIYMIDGQVQEDEKEMHNFFSHLKISSEWFINDNSIIEYFKENGSRK